MTDLDVIKGNAYGVLPVCQAWLGSFTYALAHLLLTTVPFCRRGNQDWLSSLAAPPKHDEQPSNSRSHSLKCS